MGINQIFHKFINSSSVIEKLAANFTLFAESSNLDKMIKVAEFDSVTDGWITPVTAIVIIIAIIPRNGQWAFFLLLIDTPFVEWVKKMVKGKTKAK